MNNIGDDIAQAFNDGYEAGKSDSFAWIKELQAEVDALKHDIARYVQMNTELLNDRPELEEIGGKWVWKEPKQRKLGRWEKAKPKGVVVYSDGYAECSSCHEVIWLGWGMNFCPHCGVQNRIIDPDDIAKMEVQE